MATSTVYRDITKYKAKFLGKEPRNIIGIAGIGVALVLNVVNVVLWHFPQAFTYLTIVCFAVPSFLFGFAQKDNMPFERYIRRLFIYYMTYRLRLYQTERIQKTSKNDFIPNKDETEYTNES